MVWAYFFTVLKRVLLFPLAYSSDVLFISSHLEQGRPPCIH